jgi:hypothetical protein
MAKKKDWLEGELVMTFGLTKIIGNPTLLMREWVEASSPVFSVVEQHNFETTYQKGLNGLPTWSEEDLKMKFISPVLELGRLLEDKRFSSFFDKKLEAVVDNYKLVVRADFVIAKGIMDYMERPFFHFQEYKPEKNPTGDSMAQLLEAFLIAEAQNNDNKPLYGCEVNGATWKFIIMEARTYCISNSYDCTNQEDLLKIIAILRKFREILETRLLV